MLRRRNQPRTPSRGRHTMSRKTQSCAAATEGNGINDESPSILDNAMSWPVLPGPNVPFGEEIKETFSIPLTTSR